MSGDGGMTSERSGGGATGLGCGTCSVAHPANNARAAAKIIILVKSIFFIASPSFVRLSLPSLFLAKLATEIEQHALRAFPSIL
jgi:hypothetical protein